MIEIFEYNGNDFKAVMQYEGWKIGLLRYSKRFSSLQQMERHTLSDEAFILLCGESALYIVDENNIKKYAMENGKVYNVKKNTWHHIIVTDKTTVLVVENSNTSQENTAKMDVSNFRLN